MKNISLLSKNFGLVSMAKLDSHSTAAFRLKSGRIVIEEEFLQRILEDAYVQGYARGSDEKTCAMLDAEKARVAA